MGDIVRVRLAETNFNEFAEVFLPSGASWDYVSAIVSRRLERPNTKIKFLTLCDHKNIALSPQLYTMVDVSKYISKHNSTARAVFVVHGSETSVEENDASNRRSTTEFQHDSNSQSLNLNNDSERMISFRLSSNLNHVVDLLLKFSCTWNSIRATILQAFSLHLDTIVDRIILENQAGDILSPPLTDENKFWKFIELHNHKNKVYATVYVYSTQNSMEEHREAKYENRISNQHTELEKSIPLNAIPNPIVSKSLEYIPSSQGKISPPSEDEDVAKIAALICGKQFTPSNSKKANNESEDGVKKEYSGKPNGDRNVPNLKYTLDEEKSVPQSASGHSSHQQPQLPSPPERPQAPSEARWEQKGTNSNESRSNESWKGHAAQPLYIPGAQPHEIPGDLQWSQRYEAYPVASDVQQREILKRSQVTGFVPEESHQQYYQQQVHQSYMNHSSSLTQNIDLSPHTRQPYELHHGHITAVPTSNVQRSDRTPHLERGTNLSPSSDSFHLMHSSEADVSLRSQSLPLAEQQERSPDMPRSPPVSSQLRHLPFVEVQHSASEQTYEELSQQQTCYVQRSYQQAYYDQGIVPSHVSSPPFNAPSETSYQTAREQITSSSSSTSVRDQHQESSRPAHSSQSSALSERHYHPGSQQLPRQTQYDNTQAHAHVSAQTPLLSEQQRVSVSPSAPQPKYISRLEQDMFQQYNTPPLMKSTIASPYHQSHLNKSQEYHLTPEVHTNFTVSPDHEQRNALHEYQENQQRYPTQYQELGGIHPHGQYQPLGVTSSQQLQHQQHYQPTQHKMQQYKQVPYSTSASQQYVDSEYRSPPVHRQVPSDLGLNYGSASEQDTDTEYMPIRSSPAHQQERKVPVIHYGQTSQQHIDAPNRSPPVLQQAHREQAPHYSPTSQNPTDVRYTSNRSPTTNQQVHKEQVVHYLPASQPPIDMEYVLNRSPEVPHQVHREQVAHYSPASQQPTDVEYAPSRSPAVPQPVHRKQVAHYSPASQQPTDAEYAPNRSPEVPQQVRREQVAHYSPASQQPNDMEYAPNRSPAVPQQVRREQVAHYSPASQQRTDMEYAPSRGPAVYREQVAHYSPALQQPTDAEYAPNRSPEVPQQVRREQVAHYSPASQQPNDMEYAPNRSPEVPQQVHRKQVAHYSPTSQQPIDMEYAPNRSPEVPQQVRKEQGAYYSPPSQQPNDMEYAPNRSPEVPQQIRRENGAQNSPAPQQPTDNRSPAVPQQMHREQVTQYSPASQQPTDNRSPAVPQQMRREQVTQYSPASQQPTNNRSPVLPQQMHREQVTQYSPASQQPTDNRSPAVPQQMHREQVTQYSPASQQPADMEYAPDCSPAVQQQMHRQQVSHYNPVSQQPTHEPNRRSVTKQEAQKEQAPNYSPISHRPVDNVKASSTRLDLQHSADTAQVPSNSAAFQHQLHSEQASHYIPVSPRPTNMEHAPNRSLEVHQNLPPQMQKQPEISQLIQVEQADKVDPESHRGESQQVQALIHTEELQLLSPLSHQRFDLDMAQPVSRKALSSEQRRHVKGLSQHQNIEHGSSPASKQQPLIDAREKAEPLIHIVQNEAIPMQADIKKKQADIPVDLEGKAQPQLGNDTKKVATDVLRDTQVQRIPSKPYQEELTTLSARTNDTGIPHKSGWNNTVKLNFILPIPQSKQMPKAIDVSKDSSWDDLKEIVAKSFNMAHIDDISHFLLVDNAGDILTAELDTVSKFWKQGVSLQLNNDEDESLDQDTYFRVEFIDNKKEIEFVTSSSSIHISACLNKDKANKVSLIFPNGLHSSEELVAECCAAFGILGGENIQYFSIEDDEVYGKKKVTDVKRSDTSRDSLMSAIAMCEILSNMSAIELVSKLLVVHGEHPPSNNNLSVCLCYACALGDSHLVASLLRRCIHKIHQEPFLYGIEPMLRCSSNGHAEVLRQLVGLGIPINITDADGMTPLHYACQQFNTRAAELLITQGADVDIRNNNGITPLHYLCTKEGNVEIYEKLISRDRVNILNNAGESLLLCAVNKNFMKIVKYLINNGADVDLGDLNGYNPLHHSCSIGNKRMVLYLVKQGKAYLNARDINGMSPFLYAMKGGHFAIAKWLSSLGVSVHARDNNGNNALHFAATLGYRSHIMWILSCGVDLGSRNYDGLSAYHLAAKMSHHDIASWLESLGAKATFETYEESSIRNFNDREVERQLRIVEKKECLRFSSALNSIEMDHDMEDNIVTLTTSSPSSNITSKKEVKVIDSKNDANEDLNNMQINVEHSLCEASFNGDIEGVQNFLSMKDIDTRWVDGNGCTALHYACSGGHLDIAQILVEYGFGTVAVDNVGSTPLHIACRGGHEDLCLWLLSVQVDINMFDKEGCTPLFYACITGLFHFLQAALDVDKALTEKIMHEHKRFYLLHCAADYGQVYIIEMLLRANTLINVIDKNKRTPLHLACLRGHHEAAYILTENKANISWRDEDGNTAFLFACLSGSLDVMIMLLSRGASITETNKRGNTCLHAACQADSPDAALWLAEYSGVPLDTKNKLGLTPIDLARLAEHHQVVEILERKLVKLIPVADTKNSAKQGADNEAVPSAIQQSKSYEVQDAEVSSENKSRDRHTNISAEATSLVPVGGNKVVQEDAAVQVDKEIVNSIDVSTRSSNRSVEGKVEVKGTSDVGGHVDERKDVSDDGGSNEEEEEDEDGSECEEDDEEEEDEDDGDEEEDDEDDEEEDSSDGDSEEEEEEEEQGGDAGKERERNSEVNAVSEHEKSLDKNEQSSMLQSLENNRKSNVSAAYSIPDDDQDLNEFLMNDLSYHNAGKSESGYAPINYSTAIVGNRVEVKYKGKQYYSTEIDTKGDSIPLEDTLSNHYKSDDAVMEDFSAHKILKTDPKKGKSTGKVAADKQKRNKQKYDRDTDEDSVPMEDLLSNHHKSEDTVMEDFSAHKILKADPRNRTSKYPSKNPNAVSSKSQNDKHTRKQPSRVRQFEDYDDDSEPLEDLLSNHHKSHDPIMEDFSAHKIVTNEERRQRNKRNDPSNDQEPKPLGSNEEKDEALKASPAYDNRTSPQINSTLPMEEFPTVKTDKTINKKQYDKKSTKKTLNSRDACVCEESGPISIFSCIVSQSAMADFDDMSYKNSKWKSDPPIFDSNGNIIQNVHPVSGIDALQLPRSSDVASSRSNSLAYIKYLPHELDIEHRDEFYRTNLHDACLKEDFDLTQHLINLGADIDARDAQGLTPFLCACAANHLEIARWLSENGANIFIESYMGSNALHIACKIGNYDMATWLLSKGLDAKKRNADKMTAIDLANILGFKDIYYALSVRVLPSIQEDDEETRGSNEEKEDDQYQHHVEDVTNGLVKVSSDAIVKATNNNEEEDGGGVENSSESSSEQSLNHNNLDIDDSDHIGFSQMGRNSIHNDITDLLSLSTIAGEEDNMDL